MGKPFSKTGLGYLTNVILLKEFSATNQNFFSHFLRGEGSLAEVKGSGTSPGESTSFCMEVNFEDQGRVRIEGSMA